MKIVILLFGICIFINQITLSQTSRVKVNFYNVETNFASSSKDIKVIANLQIQKFDALRKVQFLLNSKSKIRSVKYLKNNKWIGISFQFNGKDSLLLNFGDQLLPANKYRLRFEYSFPIDTPNDSLLLFDRGNRWYPLIIDQIASFKLTCEVPKGYRVLSSGDLLSMKDKGEYSYFVWGSKLPVFKIPLLIFNPAMLEEKEVNSLGVKIDLFYTNADSSEASIIAMEAVKAFDYYKNNIGNYPYKKLTIIEVPQFQGINTASGLIMMGTYSLEMIKRKYYNGLDLTIAQQWIGAGVFAKYGKPGFWFLSLSLPHYLRLMYIRKTQGEKSFLKALQQPLSKYSEFSGKETDIPIISINSINSKEKGLILYAKGPFVISKIEEEMGKEKWLSFLKNICLSFRGKILTYDEFKKNLSKYDEKGSVLALFDKLMSEKGMPE